MAQKNSLAWWTEEFGELEDSLDDIKEQITQLEKFVTDIALDMARFEKHIERGPTLEEIADSLKAMKLVAKDALKEHFATATRFWCSKRRDQPTGLSCDSPIYRNRAVF